MRNDGVRVCQTGAQVFRFQIRIVGENGLRRFALSEQAENKLDGNAHTPNDWFAPKDLRIGSNTAQ